MSTTSDLGHSQALAPGVVLRTSSEGAEGFEIKSVLGKGGFGIGYLARDLTHDCDVFIKEHFPCDCAIRSPHGVAVTSCGDREDYEWSLQHFIEEGKALAQLRGLEGIVTVLQTFRANGTAYMVTTYEQARNVNEYLRELGRPATEEECLAILKPLLAGLTAVHARQYLHRDISADNVLIKIADGKPLLIDFGSARYAASRRAGATRVAIKPKYAPYEFYDDLEQGPWSDLYSLVFRP